MMTRTAPRISFFVVMFLSCHVAHAGEVADLYATQAERYSLKMGTPRSFEQIEADDHGITEIGLERTQCYGECPVYSVVIRRNGTFRYEGIDYVQRKGYQTGTVDEWQFHELSQFIRDAGYMQLADSYSINITDLPTVYSTVVMNGKRKVIKHYANAGPTKLWAIEQLIDRLLADAHWDKKPRRQKKSDELIPLFEDDEDDEEIVLELEPLENARKETARHENFQKIHHVATGSWTTRSSRLSPALLSPALSFGSLLSTGMVMAPMAGKSSFDPKPTPEELINETGRFTGLSKGTLSVLLGESPALVADLNDTVTAVNIVNKILDGKDGDAMMELVKWRFDNFVEDLAKDALPKSFNTFVTAFKAYKATLELAHDYLFIPKLDAAIYKRYRRNRLNSLKDGDTSPESVVWAYTQATTSGGKWLPLRDKMYKDYIASLDYNLNSIGKDSKLGSKLWKQSTKYWETRMEAKFQRERFVKSFKKGRDKKLDAVWDPIRKQLADMIGPLTISVVDGIEKEPISSPRVTLKHANFDVEFRPTRVTASGNAEFENLPYGVYEATVGAPGYHENTGRLRHRATRKRVAARLQKKSGEDVGDVPDDPTPDGETLGTLTLQCVDAESGAPIPNARATVGPARLSLSTLHIAERSAIPRPDGIVAFEGLPAGAYQLTASADGYELRSYELPFDPARPPGYTPLVKLQKTREPEDTDPEKIDLTPPKAGDGSMQQQIRAIETWRDAMLKKLDPATDPARLRNKEECFANAAKINVNGSDPRGCSRCGKNTVHWWFPNDSDLGPHWQCSGCEYVTQISDVPRKDGMTYREYAQKCIARVNAQRQEVIDRAKNEIARIRRAHGR